MFSSTHSFDPISPASSAAQLQNFIVLRGLQPGVEKKVIQVYEAERQGGLLG